MFKKLFSPIVSFQPADPLGDGLSDEIEAEQREPQAIHLDELDMSPDVQKFWDRVDADLHSGAQIDFSED